MHITQTFALIKYLPGQLGTKIPRSNFKYIKQILELEKNFPNFHLGWPKKKEENKEDLQRFACLDDRELDVEEAQAKTTKHVTKCAVYIFSRKFLHLLNVLQ